MRYEIMRLMQFLFSLSLLVGAFGGGLLLGWYRWGVSARTRAAATRRSERWPTAQASNTSGTARPATASSTLFSPEYDDEFDDAYGFERDLFDSSTIDLRAVSSSVRGELTVGNDEESATDDAPDWPPRQTGPHARPTPTPGCSIPGHWEPAAGARRSNPALR